MRPNDTSEWHYQDFSPICRFRDALGGTKLIDIIEIKIVDKSVKGTYLQIQKTSINRYTLFFYLYETS